MAYRLPPNVRRHRAGKFRAVVSIDGKRVVGPLRADPSVAAADAADLRARSRRSAETPTLADGFALLLRELDRNGARPDSIKSYRASWKPIVSSVGWSPAFAIEAVTTAQVERYASRRTADGRVSRRICWTKEIATLRRVTKLAAREGLIRADPLANIRIPRTRSTRYGVMSREHITAIVARMLLFDPKKAKEQRRDAALVEFIFLTGMRRSEVARLRLSDVDERVGVIHIDGKTDGRAQPITDRTRELLGIIAAGKRPDEPIVGNAALIAAIFLRWRRRLAEPLLAPHVLRHSFATAAVEAGVPHLVLADVLGHKDVRMTAKYFHGRTDTHRAALEAIQGHQTASERTTADSRLRWSSSRRSSEAASRDSSQLATEDSDTRQARRETR